MQLTVATSAATGLATGLARGVATDAATVVGKSGATDSDAPK